MLRPDGINRSTLPLSGLVTSPRERDARCDKMFQLDAGRGGSAYASAQQHVRMPAAGHIIFQHLKRPM
jgi:hypothetical protein